MRESTAIPAAWVQAICTTKAASSSFCGLALSMKLRAEFTAISEIPLFGSRAALTRAFDQDDAAELL